MKTQIMTAALIGLMTLTLTQNAHAAANPLNDRDSITISVTPNVDRGVSIDSAAVTLDLGVVSLTQSAQTISPATVTILGTLAGQELDVTGTITAPWIFDVTPSIDTASTEQDALAFYLLFSDTTLSGAPTAGEFVADNGAFTGTTLRAGGDVGNGTTFEKTGGGVFDMDTLVPTETQHLWFFLRMPGTTTSSTQKQVQITLTAADAS